MGYIARENKVNDSVLRKAVVYGSSVASYNVEDFSFNALIDLDMEKIQQRFDEFKGMTQI